MLAVITYPPIPIWEFGPLNFSLHGVFAALGFLIGSILIIRKLRERGYDTVAFQSVLTWGLIGALIGARYFTMPGQLMNGVPLMEALNPVAGNFSILGGFAGGIIAGGWRMKMVGLPVLGTLDMVSFGLALGTVVGRIGDLAIVEHLGRETTVPWGYGIKPGYDVAPQHNALECTEATVGADGFCGIYHHVAMYDMIGAAVLLGVLLFVYKRYTFHYGQLIALWGAWYGFQRFILDFMRVGSGDAEAIAGTMTWNQLSGFFIGVAGVILFFVYRKTQPLISSEEDEKRGADLELATTS